MTLSLRAKAKTKQALLLADMGAGQQLFVQAETSDTEMAPQLKLTASAVCYAATFLLNWVKQ